MTATAPKWAKGFDVDRLKAITALFAEHDTGMVHGPFGRYSETDAAADLAAGRLHVLPDGGEPEVAWVGYYPTTTIPVKDFTGQARTAIQRGTYYVTRMAWRRFPHELVDVLENEPRAPVVWAWMEHTHERALMRSLAMRCSAVKISAASEMRGLFQIGWQQVVGHPADRVCIGRLDVDVPQALTDAVLARFEDAAFADHYSGYNQRRSWSALACRGYWPDDPDRIEKPSEMNRAWKTAHPDDLDRECGDTALMGPDVRAVLDLIPGGGFQRVRIMRLAPGGGELTRHADITDPEAGTALGRVARIHFPLDTNPGCEFTTWDLDGRSDTGHMGRCSAYYLDTRKPHTAINAGGRARVHLVADVFVDVDLQILITNTWKEQANG